MKGMSMEGAYFITATGTDAGKTFVAEGLARVLHARGRAVRALKPVMSGYDASAPEVSDAGRLLAACGEAVTAKSVAAIAPWRYAAPLSPDRAAARAGPALDFDGLLAWCRREILRSEDALLVEGIGGVMTPLDAHHTVREWIAALELPVLLVAGTYLGAISHALTALSALREVDMAPAAVIVNESPGGVGIEETLASLASHVDGIPLATLARDDVAGLSRLADLLAGETA
jgi:dethiobiotin synthetase